MDDRDRRSRNLLQSDCSFTRRPGEEAEALGTEWGEGLGSISRLPSIAEDAQRSRTREHTQTGIRSFTDEDGAGERWYAA